MTRDQIIAWAKQSGAVLELSTTPAKDFAFLSRFASLVAAHEREECAKVCEEWAKAMRIKLHGEFAYLPGEKKQPPPEGGGQGPDAI